VRLITTHLFNEAIELEWIFLEYQNYFLTNSAYCIYIRWLNGTGSIISDIINIFKRRAENYEFKLVQLSSYEHRSNMSPFFWGYETTLSNPNYIHEIL
jgi:hypothetical protein